LNELAAHGAGWQAHVEDLGTYLAGRGPDAWRPRWAVLAPAYAAKVARLSDPAS
jgi:hypothetical protein